MKKSLFFGASASSFALTVIPTAAPVLGMSASALDVDAAVETASSLVVIAAVVILAGATVIINRNLARKNH